MLLPGRKPKADMNFIWGLVCAVALLPSLVIGGGSCCLPEKGMQVTDPYATMPEGWDLDDDGPWQPGLVDLIAVRGWWRWRYEMRVMVLDNCGWLLAGLLFAGVARAFKPSSDTITWALGSSNGSSCGNTMRSTCMGSLLGLLLPACSCGVIPLAVSAIGSGANISAAVAMTFVSSGSGIDSFLYTVGACGYEVALARMAAVAVLGFMSTCAASMLATKILAPRAGASEKLRSSAAADKCCAPVGESSTPDASRLSAAVQGVLVAFEEVVWYILAGVAITAASTAFQPEGGWSTAGATADADGLGAAKRLMSRLCLLGASLPLQMCEHAVVNLANGLLDAGASPGTAFAWLVLSPATSTGWALLVARHCGMFAAAAATVVALVGALALSEIIDAAGLERPSAGGGGGWQPGLPQGFVAASPWILGGLMIIALARAFLGLMVAPSKVKAN